jgi:hypothetical protein
MTDKQSNHVDMILNVIRVHNDYAPSILTKPAVDDQFQLLIAKRDLINIAIGGQSGSTATDKALLRKALDDYSYLVMAPVKGYAVTINDVTLKDDMDHSLSELSKVKDDTYVEFLNYRKNKVNSILAALAGLGYTAVTITEWELKIAAYSAAITDPRQAVINRALHTENLDRYIKEALDICNDVLDAMMVVFKATPGTGEIYTKYVMAREIIDLTGPGDGSETEAIIKVTIKDAVTTAFLAGVTVKLQEDGQELVTDAEGVVVFEPTAPGMDNVFTTLAGYASGNFPIDTVVGENNFTFQITPLP